MRCCNPERTDAISILAPAWGASYKVGGTVISQQYISILAPAWGASALFAVLAILGVVFQFSPPRGGRPPGCTSSATPRHFNSRPRVGGVPNYQGSLSVLLCYFNSRPRVGGVRPRQVIRRTGLYFNSRPRVGGVLSAGNSCSGRSISILAPAWGASDCVLLEKTRVPISILAPAWGASANSYK